MRKYVIFLLVISILFIVLGLASGKISGESFTYISLTGSLLAILQILVVVLILMLAAMMALPALIIDVLLLIFTTMFFPLISTIWNIVWYDITVGWFWTTTSGSSILFASLVLIIISVLGLRRRRR